MNNRPATYSDPRTLKSDFTELGRMLSALIDALECLDVGPNWIREGYFGNYYQAPSFKRGDRINDVYQEAEGFKDSGIRGCALIADRIHGPLRLLGRKVGERFDIFSLPATTEYDAKFNWYLEAYEIMVEVSSKDDREDYSKIPRPLTEQVLTDMMAHPSMNEGRMQVLREVTPQFFEDFEVFLTNLEKHLHQYITIRFNLNDTQGILLQNSERLNLDPRLDLSYPAHALFAMRYVGEAMIDRNEVPEAAYNFMNRAVHQENSITDTIKNLFTRIFEAGQQQLGLSPGEIIRQLPYVSARNMTKTIREQDRNLCMLYLYHEITGEIPAENVNKLKQLLQLAFDHQPSETTHIALSDSAITKLDHKEAGVILYALAKRLEGDGDFSSTAADIVKDYAEGISTDSAYRTNFKWLVELRLSHAESSTDPTIAAAATLLKSYFNTQRDASLSACR